MCMPLKSMLRRQGTPPVCRMYCIATPVATEQPCENAKSTSKGPSFSMYSWTLPTVPSKSSYRTFTPLSKYISRCDQPKRRGGSYPLRNQLLYAAPCRILSSPLSRGVCDCSSRLSHRTTPSMKNQSASFFSMFFSWTVWNFIDCAVDPPPCRQHIRIFGRPVGFGFCPVYADVFLLMTTVSVELRLAYLLGFGGVGGTLASSSFPSTCTLTHPVDGPSPVRRAYSRRPPWVEISLTIAPVARRSGSASEAVSAPARTKMPPLPSPPTTSQSPTTGFSRSLSGSLTATHPLSGPLPESR
mmetsp:Transcript_108795/g.307742  ORF Transcript_108795/g.307742 Transcript_108795/m.307742 type:complete len:299 (-) Transcript_108795:193-1089(-)